MSKTLYPFPVEALLNSVQKRLAEAQTVDLYRGIENGLKNDIQLIDRDGAYTEIASVSPQGQVYLSLAYCQFLLLMCHIGLIVHESIAMESKLKGLTEDERVSFRNSLKDDNPRNCYLRDIPDFESAVKCCSGLIDIARPLLTANPLTQQEFDDILRAVDYNSPIAISANSLCVYGIVFTLLHEASHVILGQDLMKKGTVQEEIEADHNAFWALSNDLEGKERNTAMMGCICALTSLLFFNPGLTPDENFPHPREDDRLFSFYDILKSEKNSYTEMITILLAAWATTFHVENFPVLSLSYEDSLARQRSFLSSIGRVEA